MTLPCQDFSPDADGNYHWYCEQHLFSDPTAFLTLCKVFGCVILGCGLLIGLLSQQEWPAMLRFVLRIWLWGFGSFLVIGGLSYVICARLQGGTYCVVFEMNDKGVTHIQVARQFEKAQLLGALTPAGTGIPVGSHASVQTKFKLVSRIRVDRRRRVIYLRAALTRNQVYAAAEHFDAVLDYILSHIPETAKRTGV